ncbi:retroviral-like aspartic protease family protein [Erythrobacter sp.]|jgi:predicted aspartyl protease|uniref:retroviral-like aspartic protease family protein n=1 Tax=Erythrobacter sp. TaxID=1042 RepID=UPI002EB9EE7A|nr:retroviral-like aspartic protease family protein [Erythrobacter sp.]
MGYLRLLACRAAAVVCLASLGLPASAATAQPNEPAGDDTPVRMPELPPADFDEELAIGGDEVEARKLRSRMTVEVEVNGTGPHKFVVDSGADTSVIGTRLAERLGLPPGEPVLLHAMTESRLVERALVDTIELGPSTIHDLELPVLREGDIGGDGMIGLDAVRQQRLMLDFEKRVITLEDRYEEPTDFGRNEIIVTGRLKRGQLILTEVEAQGHKVDAIVDTGSEVTIGNTALRNEIIKRRPKDIKTAEIFGVTGARQTIEFAIINKLELGPISFSNVAIAFADVPPFAVFGIDQEPALLLGTDLMETFRRVSLDFAERKVRFQLRKCGPRRAAIRTLRRATRLNTETPSACER